MSAVDWIEVTANGVWPAPSLCGGVEGPDRRAPNSEEIAICREWLRLFAVPTKTFRARHSSYGLKHTVEEWTETGRRTFQMIDPHGRPWSGSRHYVSNGAFIAAALVEGFRAKRTHSGSPNVFFNMTRPRVAR